MTADTNWKPDLAGIRADSDREFEGALLCRDVDQLRGICGGMAGRTIALVAALDDALDKLAGTVDRERIASYLDRAAAHRRKTAAEGLLADAIVADAWAEAANWCRADTIWFGGDE